jgi:hypothetical protein
MALQGALATPNLTFLIWGCECALSMCLLNAYLIQNKGLVKDVQGLLESLEL